ncbi:MAG TPA: N-acetyltransferase [Croceibacterium sp.]
MNVWAVRPERIGDEQGIAWAITSAFADAAYAGGNEAEIVRRLRDERELEASYVAATPAGEIVGHVAFSPVLIDGSECGWYGLGPLAVLPDWQRRGIGAALVEAGLERLKHIDAAGCVVLGHPRYYGRFGFAHDPALSYPGPPADHFQRLVLSGQPPSGTVAYPAAFG